MTQPRLLLAALAIGAAAAVQHVAGHAEEHVAGYHNVHEAWAHMFTSVVQPRTARGRALASSASIAFNATRVAHMEVVRVIARAPAGSGSSWWLALYSPPNANVNSTTPVRYQACIANPLWDSEGDCSADFRISNQHSGGYRAYLLANGTNAMIAQPDFWAQKPGAERMDTWVKEGKKPWVDVINMDEVDNSTAEVMAVAQEDLHFARPNQPTQLRISPGSQSQAEILTLAWNQELSSTGGRVQLASSAADLQVGRLLATVPAQDYVLTKADVCGAGPASTTGWHDMGRQWSARLDLTGFGGGQLAYRVLDDTEASDIRLLRVPIPKGDRTPFNFIAFADMGEGFDLWEAPGGRNYNNGWIAKMTSYVVRDFVTGAIAPLGSVKAPPMAVHIAGDMSYSDGYLASLSGWIDDMEPSISRAPAFYGNGNHEVDWLDTPEVQALNRDFSGWMSSDGRISSSSGGECGVAFKVLQQVSPTPGALYFSYSIGMVQFLVLSTEHDFGRGSEQYQWFEAQLQRIDRVVTPWVVVSTHRPPYLDKVTSGAAVLGTAQWMTRFWQQQGLDELVVKYGVDLVISGHFHQTQRQCSILAGRCAQNATLIDGVWHYYAPPAPIYYVTGSLGANVDPMEELSESGRNFTAYKTAAHALGVYSVVSPEVLEVRLYDVQHRRVIDTVRITNPGQGAYEPGPPATMPPGAMGGLIAGGVVAAALLVVGAYLVNRSRKAPGPAKPLTSGAAPAASGAATGPQVVTLPAA